MATVDQIAKVRRATDEMDFATYDDGVIGAFIDAASSLDAAIVEIWTEKAAKYASLVDVTESGSSRSLSNLQKQALSMAARYQDNVDASIETMSEAAVRTRIKGIVRL